MFTLPMWQTPPNFGAGSTVPYQSREQKNCSHPQGPITLASSHFAGESVFLSTCQKFNPGEWILPQINTVCGIIQTERTCALKSRIVLTHLVSWWTIFVLSKRNIHWGTPVFRFKIILLLGISSEEAWEYVYFRWHFLEVSAWFGIHAWPSLLNWPCFSKRRPSGLLCSICISPFSPALVRPPLFLPLLRKTL